MKEFCIINKYFQPLYKKNTYNFDDSCLIKQHPLQETICSKDLMVEDVHFKLSHGGYQIAKKLLAINLSDLAASGAKPSSYILGVSFGKNCDEKFISDFASGLNDVQKIYNIHLIGGDTTKNSSSTFFSLTIFGFRPKNAAKLQIDQAKENDDIYISGNIGDSFLGFYILKNKIKFQNYDPKIIDYLINKHLSPNPRIFLGQELSKHKIAHASTDISDGLLADLQNICLQSKINAKIFQNQIPFSKQAKKFIKDNRLDFNITNLISWGEDYELIFTIKKENESKIATISKELDLKISRIGFFQQKSQNPKLTLFNQNMVEIKITNYGYQH
ncbi:thiamine-phosphate kinase [Flavobacteriaceae bacterium]|nr:thiamine-phosphate kinase [Flavobacteriaceae bacterium]